MRAHVIESGIVINTIIVKSLSELPNLINAENGGGIGWKYDGSTFIEPDPISKPITAPTKEQLMAQLQALTQQINAL